MDYSLVRAAEGSNLAPSEKTQLRRIYERINSVGMARVKHHAVETAQSFRHGSESMVTGAILGLVDAEVGLDIQTKHTKVPIDGVLGFMMLAGAAYPGPGEFIGRDMQNVGGTAIGISTFRSVKAWREAKIAAGGGIKNMVSNVAGDLMPGHKRTSRVGAEFGTSEAIDADPIVACARSL